LSHRFNKPAGRLSPLGQVHLVCIQKGDGLDVAEANALRIAVTVIALHRDPFTGIEERMPEGTGDDAGSTSDAQLLVDGHAVIVFWFSVAGLRRTDFHAIGFFAVVAGHWKVDSRVFPLDHFDPGTARIACPRMKYGTYHLAQPTAGTLLLVNDQYFFIHSALLLLDQNVTRKRDS
jgi:hypothetical protein